MNLEKDNRELVDRIVIEKQNLVNKILELNKQEQEIQVQKSMVIEEEKYFNQRKQ